MVSIIVITFNRKNYLLECIDSILNQTFKEIELIVVDDGSTDGTVEAIRTMNDDRIRIISPGKIGNLSSLRNIGIKEAKGDFISFCDDDDLWHEEKLDEQMRITGKHSLICSNASVIDEHGNTIGDKYFDDIDKDFIVDKNFLLSKGNPVLTSSLIVPGKLFLKDGLYFDEFEFTNRCEDFELFIRMSEKNPIYFLNKPLVSKRLHKSVSGGIENNLLMLRESIRILSRYLKNNPDRKTRNQVIEGILGYMLVRNKLSFKKGILSGMSDLASLLSYIASPNVAYVFAKTKLLHKLTKTFSVKGNRP